MPVYEVNSSEDFKKVIQHPVVVIDFYAEWCGPCKKIAPEIEKLSNKYTNIKFCKINVDELDKLSNTFKVTSLPTFVFLKNDTKNSTEVARVMGANLTAVNEAILKLL